MSPKIIPADIVEIAKFDTSSNEYLALFIAGQQSTWRQPAFKSAERCLQERTISLGLSASEGTTWVAEQFSAIKKLVEQIDSCQQRGAP